MQYKWGRSGGVWAWQWYAWKGLYIPRSMRHSSVTWHQTGQCLQECHHFSRGWGLTGRGPSRSWIATGGSGFIRLPALSQWPSCDSLLVWKAKDHACCHVSRALLGSLPEKAPPSAVSLVSEQRDDLTVVVELLVGHSGTVAAPVRQSSSLNRHGLASQARQVELALETRPVLCDLQGLGISCRLDTKFHRRHHNS